MRNVNDVLTGLLVGALIYMMMYGCGGFLREGFRDIQSAPAADGRVTDLEHSIQCAPGMEKGSYYSKNRGPGGLCNDQELVNKVMHQYEITSGVGGSLI